MVKIVKKRTCLFAFNHNKTEMLDWVPDQLLHYSDTDPAKFNDFRANQFIGFIATNPGVTYIRVITRSQNIGAENYKKSSYVHVVALEQYEYFVAKPTLIHGRRTSNKPRTTDDNNEGSDKKMTTCQSASTVDKNVSSEASSAGAQKLVCDPTRYRNSRLHLFLLQLAKIGNAEYLLLRS